MTYRLFTEDDEVLIFNSAGSTANQLAVTLTGVRVLNADVTAVDSPATQSWNPEVAAVAGSDEFQRTDVTRIQIDNLSTGTPEVRVRTNISDVVLTVFVASVPPGYSAVYAGSAWTVAPTGSLSASGVSRLVAGDNVTLNPSDGAGTVTVTAADASAEGALMAENNLDDVTDSDVAVENLGLAVRFVSTSGTQLGEHVIGSPMYGRIDVEEAAGTYVLNELGPALLYAFEIGDDVDLSVTQPAIWLGRRFAVTVSGEAVATFDVSNIKNTDGTDIAGIEIGGGAWVVLEGYSTTELRVVRAADDVVSLEM